MMKAYYNCCKHWKPEFKKAFNYTIMNSARYIALCNKMIYIRKFLGQGCFWVWCPTYRRAVNRGKQVVNRDYNKKLDHWPVLQHTYHSLFYCNDKRSFWIVQQKYICEQLFWTFKECHNEVLISKYLNEEECSS